VVPHSQTQGSKVLPQQRRTSLESYDLSSDDLANIVTELQQRQFDEELQLIEKYGGDD